MKYHAHFSVCTSEIKDMQMKQGLENVAYQGMDSTCGASQTNFILQAVLYTSLPGL